MIRTAFLTALIGLGLASTASAQYRVHLPSPAPLPTPVPLPRPTIAYRPAYVPQTYLVEYRAPWQERRFHCVLEARAFERQMELRGYDARTVSHGNHFDVQYRVSGWQPYRTLYNSFAAYGLERDLGRQGINARVVQY